MTTARLGAGQRALIIGKTGTGKTHLVRTALRQVNSWVVIDSKRGVKPNEPSIWAARLAAIVSKDPADILRHRRVVWQVSERSLMDRGGWQRSGSWGFLWTAGLRKLKQRGHTIVVFNEGLQTLPAGRCHPEAKEIFTQGAGYDLTAWVETQAANWLDTVILRQVEALIAFRCRGAQDRELIARAREVDASPLAELRPYWWAYHDLSQDEFQVFPPLPAPSRTRPKKVEEVDFADAAAPAEIDGEAENGGNVRQQTPEESARVDA